MYSPAQFNFSARFLPLTWSKSRSMILSALKVLIYLWDLFSCGVQVRRPAAVNHPQMIEKREVGCSKALSFCPELRNDRAFAGRK